MQYRAHAVRPYIYAGIILKFRIPHSALRIQKLRLCQFFKMFIKLFCLDT